MRSGGYQPGAFQVAHASTGCAAVPPAPSLAASYFPRVVVPREHINVELHEGDGNSPPENVWVAWHYPGTSEPGNAGNSYVYGHAHGNPPDSAPGLFWNLHYVHNCDAVYVYSSPSAAIRYQVSYVNLSWPARNTTVFNPTPDERVTLQTCNGWGNEDPKVIVIAERFIDPPPPPPPSPPPSSSAGASSPDGTMGTGGATPKPSPYGLPCPIITCSGETRIRST